MCWDGFCISTTFGMEGQLGSWAVQPLAFIKRSRRDAESTIIPRMLLSWFTHWVPSQRTHPSQTVLVQLRSQLNCPDLEITFKELWQVNFIFQRNWHIILILNQIFQPIHWFPWGLRPQHTCAPLGDLMCGRVDYSWAFQLQETFIQLLCPNVLIFGRLSVPGHIIWVLLAVNFKLYSPQFCTKRS